MHIGALQACGRTNRWGLANQRRGGRGGIGPSVRQTQQDQRDAEADTPGRPCSRSMSEAQATRNGTARAPASSSQMQGALSAFNLSIGNTAAKRRCCATSARASGKTCIPATGIHCAVIGTIAIASTWRASPVPRAISAATINRTEPGACCKCARNIGSPSARAACQTAGETQIGASGRYFSQSIRPSPCSSDRLYSPSMSMRVCAAGMGLGNLSRPGAGLLCAILSEIPKGLTTYKFCDRGTPPTRIPWERVVRQLWITTGLRRPAMAGDQRCRPDRTSRNINSDRRVIAGAGAGAGAGAASAPARGSRGRADRAPSRTVHAKSTDKSTVRGCDAAAVSGSLTTNGADPTSG